MTNLGLLSGVKVLDFRVYQHMAGMAYRQWEEDTEAVLSEDGYSPSDLVSWSQTARLFPVSDRKAQSRYSGGSK